VKEPDRPKQLSFRSNIEADLIEVSLRTGSNAIGGFMLVWLTGWTVGCVFLFTRVREDPQLATLLFAVPFWASWLFVVWLAATMLLGRETFALDHEGARYRRRLPPLSWARVRMPLEELIRFGTIEDETQSSDDNSTTVVNLQTIGSPIRFGSMLGDAERTWLAYTLNQRLSKLQRTLNRKPTLPVDARVVVFGRRLPGELLGDDAPKGQVLRTTNDLPLEAPSDSHWRKRDDFDSVRFWSRGRFSLGAILGVGFLNLFVNGIIGVFAKQLYWPEPDERKFGLDWLYHFLFLIPFEIIGLILFVGWLLVIVEPVRKRHWRFSNSSIVWRMTWLGLGPWKTYHIDRIDRLEVRRIKPTAATTPNGASPDSARVSKGPVTYHLVCVDSYGQPAAEVKGLTFGEACWMADSLLRAQAVSYG